MEALLPSEIARLVLGYLEEQKCTEAAKMFLETCPHLQECRMVLSSGRRFGTRVNGLTLLDIIEKFSAASAMENILAVQERLSKVLDCEQRRPCGDLLEQLKFLVEETRSQRFVVNINVPSQTNQLQNGSPIISGSIRKRHHSNSERERCKRANKTNFQADQQLPQHLTSQVEATPLESLPGSTGFSRERDRSDHQNEVLLQNQLPQKTPETCKNSNDASGSSNMKSHQTVESTPTNSQNEPRNCKEVVLDHNVLQKCTMGTSTEELFSLCSTEVQTNPYEIPESETEGNDDPIENLSLLTKELLNRTELQERIAEKINKAIVPLDVSMKDESLCESAGNDLNSSLMTNLNIKSIVKATESDPAFETFLGEIFGHPMETDTSPDEDAEVRNCPEINNDLPGDQCESVMNLRDLPLGEQRLQNDAKGNEIPLKQRLRSSSRQQNARTEDDIEKQKEQEKEQTTLEHQNAAAILSIINANITNSEFVSEKKDAKESKETEGESTKQQSDETIVNPVNSDEADKTFPTIQSQKSNDVVNEAEGKTKKTVKRPRATKPKREMEIAMQKLMTEEEIMAMPTLIVCSKEEISNLMNINPSCPPSSSGPITAGTSSHFIPIAPKDSTRMAKPETIYLRTVKVPTKVPTNKTTEPPNSTKNVQLPVKSAPAAGTRVSVDEKNISPVGNVNNVVFSALENVQVNKISVAESITLYSSENSAGTLLENANVPTFNVDDNVSLSGTGLSPYLKFSNGRNNQNNSLSDIDLAPYLEPAKNIVQPTQSFINEEKQMGTKNDVIAKRTPRSLMKSRAKNHRLSLSTPRRRSSHVRALDFNTPTKSNSSHKGNGNDGSRFSPRTGRHNNSICRTSLFKSPPFTGATDNITKIKSPLRIAGKPCKVPVATRSPAPKLQGGWDKYHGVGVIIGDQSPQKITPEKEEEVKETRKVNVSKASWDADLRKCIQVNQEDQQAKIPSAKKKPPTKDKKANVPSKSTSVKIKCRTTRKPSVSDKSESDAQKENKSLENETLQEDPSTQEVAKPNTEPKDYRGQNSDGKMENLSGQLLSKPTNPEEKKTVKKYAQLKTLSTNLKKNFDRKDGLLSNCSTMDNSLSRSDFIRVSVDILHQPLPNIIDLETPRKENVSGVPPTPRLLSPNSSITTPFVKLGEDSGKPLQGFVNTPEFPTTPCIALTPKQVEENTINEKLKGEGPSCANYYRPTVESKENELTKASDLPKNITTNANNAGDESIPIRLEITQFEVIKENLPREEAVKELKISSKETRDAEEIGETRKEKEKFITENEKYVSDSENDTTDSDTSTTSDSSCSSSSSSSSSSGSEETDTSTRFSLEKKHRKTPHKTHDDTRSRDSSLKVQNVRSASKEPAKRLEKIDETSENKEMTIENVKSEVSPQKTFSLTKTDEQLKDSEMETPAKDESLLAEMDISETPSSSKTGVENLTNLSSKISALITSDNDIKNSSPKAKVMDVQRIKGEASLPLKSIVENPGTTSEQNLVAELEEKRQRLIAKFKEAPKSRFSRTRSRVKRATAVKHVKVMESTASNTAEKQEIKRLGETMDQETLEEKKKMINSKDKKDDNSNTEKQKENSGNKAEEVETNAGKKIEGKNSKPKEGTVHKTEEDHCHSHSTVLTTQNEGESVDRDSGGNNEKKDKPADKGKMISTSTNNDSQEIPAENDSLDPPKQQPLDTNDDKTIVPRSYGNRADSKGILKEKVEQVKRDLFSDEENEQRSGRSQSQTRDNKKDDNESNDNREDSGNDGKVENEETKVPSSVLQCLQLVPACKNGQIEEEGNDGQVSTTNSVEYHFVFDEATATRRRRRRYSSRELEYPVNVELSEEDYRQCRLLMTPSNYEEIFSMSPKPGRRVMGKKSLVKKDKSCASEDGKLNLNNGSVKPLATSSPILRTQTNKSKKAIAKQGDEKNDNKRKQSNNEKQEENQEENGNGKFRKRKTSESTSQETKQSEKKIRTTDSQAHMALVKLNAVDLDAFLTSVHGK